MKISASLYSWKGYTPEDAVRAIEFSGADYIHVDSIDDTTVFDDIARIRQITDMPIDLHVISDRPEAYFDGIVQNRVELAAFQYENLVEPLSFPDEIAKSTKIGLSLRTGTSLDAFNEYSAACSFIMLMTTTPGISGGTFDPACFTEVREMLARYPNKAVHVDGGVNREVGLALKTMGVSCAVAGSYIAKADSAATAVLHMQRDLPGLHYSVRDFMLRINQLPVVRAAEASLEAILTAINRARMGFAAVVDDDGMLVGIVADGDVRRALIRKIDNLGALVPDDVINRQFLALREDDPISDMIERMRSSDRPVMFFPVVNEAGRLTGALSFNSLVNGDL